MNRAIVVEDTLKVLDINKDGKHFEKGKAQLNLTLLVSRISAKGELYELDVTMDINTDIYTMEKDAVKRDYKADQI